MSAQGVHNVLQNVLKKKGYISYKAVSDRDQGLLASKIWRI